MLDGRAPLLYSSAMDAIARWLIGIGALVLGVGLLLLLAAKLGLPLGRLPGDIAIERDGFRFYFPLGTCLVISALLTLTVWVVARLR
ncbi:MAG TPA: DUF2905 domain-containing protein [Myxococcota bacterium]|nr:DUF2905 domain-containing protein [Myxococcota bacterium]